MAVGVHSTRETYSPSIHPPADNRYAGISERGSSGGTNSNPTNAHAGAVAYTGINITAATTASLRMLFFPSPRAAHRSRFTHLSPASRAPSWPLPRRVHPSLGPGCFPCPRRVCPGPARAAERSSR
jgi:hypothetical protein